MTYKALIKLLPFLNLSVCLLLLLTVWFRGGFYGFYLDTDLGRDLHELSNLWRGDIVWLGPHLSAGFPTSPVYYYIVYPFFWLSGGNARSLLIFTSLLTTIALASLALILHHFQNRLYRGHSILHNSRASRHHLPTMNPHFTTTILTILPLLSIGLTPWLRLTAIHPGNGYTYAIWLLFSLILLYFELPLILASLTLGLALAYHPAAIFAVPIFLYEWWRRYPVLKTSPTSRSLLNIAWKIVLNAACFILPWTPIIIFESITKGYLTREWLAHSSPGLTLTFELENIHNFAQLLNLPTILFGLLWLWVFYLACTRFRIWWGIITLSILAFCLITRVPTHYLFGISCLATVLMVLTFLHHRLGQAVLVLFIIWQSLTILWTPIPQPLTRSIPALEKVTETIAITGNLQRQSKIAVVAALTDKTEVPQADDYRYFLRILGYNVLHPQQYNEADTLIMFIEQPDFDWQHWNNWELEHFGKNTAELVYQTQVIDTTVIIYRKK